MTAAILDDELYCSEALFYLIKKHCPQITAVEVFTDSDQALEAVRRDAPDILFLDVEMPFMSGFDFVQALGPTPISIIFTTAYDMYAVQAFKVNAVDYLLKPIDKDELINAVNKVVHKPQPIDQQLLTGLIRTAIDQQSPKKVAIHTQDGIHMILLEEILYCKSDGSYSFIFLKDRTPLMVSKNLTEMEELVKSSEFFRVHKTHLINKNHIQRVNKSDGGSIIMSNNESIPISRQRKVDFFEWLAR